MGTCCNSTVVEAPIEEVWRVVRNFHDLSWAQGLDLKVKPTNDLKEDQLGTGRAINGTFFETLVALDDVEHTLVYTIDDGPGPVGKNAVQNYYGKMRLFPITDTGNTFVIWTSQYDSPDDKAVGELCNPIYHGALQGLKKFFS